MPGWPASPSADAFVVALAEHRQLLDEVRRTSEIETPRVLEGLLQDLEIKARQCRRFGGPVPVHVRVVTRDGSHQEVLGYEVWFVRKAYEHRPRAARRFDENSSPADRVFQEAGYYVLWAEDPWGRRRGAALDVEVGAEQREQHFDLLAPVIAAEPAARAAANDSSTRP